MKTYIYKSIAIVLFIVAFISCNEDGIDNVFDSSASDRITAAVAERTDQLTSATEGWIFEYYPEEEQSYGGWNYIVSFDTNGEATVYSERAADFTIPETSSYKVNNVGGPVLSFDTYNTLMHEFATPSANEYQAKGGDFEFKLASTDTDVINATGTISGNTLKLLRLTETPEEYLTKVVDNVDYLTGSSFFRTVDGVLEDVVSSNRNLTFFGEDEEGGNLEIAYIITDTGVKFYESVTIDGVEISELILDTTTQTLTSVDGSLVLDILVSPLNMEQEWFINSSIITDTSDSYKEIYAGMEANLAATYGFLTVDPIINIGQITSIGGTGININSIDSRVFDAAHSLNFKGILGSPGLLEITKGSETFSFWSFFSYYESLVDYIADNSPYSLEIDNPDDPKVVKLTSTVDSNVWFTIRK